MPSANAQAAESYAAEVSASVRRLTESSVNADRLNAARKLTELGIRERRSILPRGTPEEAAPNRLPDSSHLRVLIQSLKNADGEELRREVVSALGEWGDGNAARAIRETLEASDNPQTQRACINALMRIGGPEGMTGLRWAEEQESLHRAATWAKEELETGGTVDYSEGTTVRPSSKGQVQADSRMWRALQRTMAARPMRLRALVESILKLAFGAAVATFAFVVFALLPGSVSWPLVGAFFAILAILFLLLAGFSVVMWLTMKSRSQDELRDTLRLNRVFPILEDVLRPSDPAIEQMRDLPPDELKAAIEKLIAFKLAYVQRLFQEYCGELVAVTLKILEDPEHFRTIFGPGVQPKRKAFEPRTMRLQGTFSGRIFQSGKTWIIPDATSKKSQKRVQMNLADWPDRLKYVQSMVGSPILVDGKVYAVLVIDAPKPGVFRNTRATESLAWACAQGIGSLCSSLYSNKDRATPEPSLEEYWTLLREKLAAKHVRQRHKSGTIVSPDQQRAFGVWLINHSKRFEEKDALTT